MNSTIVEDVKKFYTLNLPNGNEVHFFSLIPLYKEEMDLKLKRGADALFEKLGKAGVDPVEVRVLLSVRLSKRHEFGIVPDS